MEPATRPYLEPGRSNPYIPITILILSSHLHKGLPTGLFQTSFVIKALYLFITAVIRAAFPAHLILKEIILELFNVQFSPSSCYFIPLRPTRIPRQTTLKYPQYVSFP